MWIFLAAAMLGIVPAKEELVLLSDTPGIGKVYVDLASVRASPEGRVANRKHLFETVRAEDGAAGILTETVFRCDTKELRETTKTTFRANGSPIESSPSISSRWSWAGSSPERSRMLDLVCARKM